MRKGSRTSPHGLSILETQLQTYGPLKHKPSIAPDTLAWQRCLLTRIEESQPLPNSVTRIQSFYDRQRRRKGRLRRTLTKLKHQSHTTSALSIPILHRPTRLSRFSDSTRDTSAMAIHLLDSSPSLTPLTLRPQSGTERPAESLANGMAERLSSPSIETTTCSKLRDYRRTTQAPSTNARR